MMWINCRETFHYYIDRNQSGFDHETKHKFYFAVDNPHNTMDLVGYVEDQLHIKEKTRFHFLSDYKPANTIKQNILQIEPAGFWKAQPMRQAFLTCCLKSTLKSYGWDHLRTMLEYTYFKSTWDAAQRFLAGHTWYTPKVPKTGWLKAFTPLYDRNGQQSYSFVLEEILVRPTEQHVGDHARQLWMEAGEPHGRDLEFWNQAKIDVMP